MLEVIETHTENILTSEEFITLEKSVVESVVKRKRLNVKEVDLFKAVDRWATKQVEKQRLTPRGKVKRRILGEEIVKAIRFSVISQKEFASVVVDCDILTKKEIGFMMKHYSGVGLEPFLHSCISPDSMELGSCIEFIDLQCITEPAGSARVSGKMPSLLVSVNLSRYKECSILVVKVANTQFP